MPRVVGDQHERRAVGAELVQELDHLAARFGVEVAGRLVGEDDLRPLRDRAGDRDPLALAARELLRAEVEPVLEPDPLERGAGRRAALAQRRAGVEHPVGDVVDGAHRLLEVEGLEHEPDPVRPQPGELAVGRAGDVVAGDVHVPLVGRSSVPRIVSIVVLPDPEGPTTATCSPSAISTADAAQRRDVTGVPLDDVIELDALIPASRSLAAPSRSPEPEIWTYPAANRPVCTGISVCGAAASWTAKLPPLVASSAVTGTDSTFRARACTKLTLTAAWSSPPRGRAVERDRDRDGRPSSPIRAAVRAPAAGARRTGRPS